MTTFAYNVPAMHYGHCTYTVEMEVGDLEGVQTVMADLATKKVHITLNEPASEEKMKALLAEIDYPTDGLISL